MKQAIYERGAENACRIPWLYNPAAVEAVLPLYYEMMGWDPSTGVPRPAKLHELDIGWVAKMLR